MEINFSDDRKLVEVWLTNQEKEDKILQKYLEILYQQYKAKKHSVVVFKSGDQDLAEEISTLLCYNRKRLAEHEVRQKRAHVPQRADTRQKRPGRT